MSGVTYFPFGQNASNIPATDVTIYGPDPGIVFEGLEANAQWAEIREVAGTFWQTQNAEWNGTAWTQVNPTLHSYAIEKDASGNTNWLSAAPAAPNPIVWTNYAAISNTGAFSGTVATGVTAVTATSPIASSGGVTPVISISTTPTFMTVGTSGAMTAGTSVTASTSITAGTFVNSPKFESLSGNGVLGIFNVKDFGAVGNGSTDDTVAIQAAITAAEVTGGIVWFPNGTYKTSATLTITAAFVTLQGECQGNTTIAPTNLTTDCIHITASFTQITNLSISYGTVATAGAGIHQSTTIIQTFYTNVLISSAWIGFLIESGATSSSQCTIANGYVEFCGNVGIYCGNNTAPFQGLTVTNTFVGQCAHGLWLENISGGNFVIMDLIQNTNDGIVINPGVGEYCVFLFFSQVQCDSNLNIGWAILGGGNVGTIMCENCWASANTNQGILLNTATLTGFVWNNGIIQANGVMGILVNSGAQVAISNSQIYNNGTASNNTYDGITVGNNVSSFNLSNNFSGVGGNFGGVNHQRYGILITGTNNNHFVILGNILQGNNSGGLLNGGTGAQQYVAGNIT